MSKEVEWVEISEICSAGNPFSHSCRVVLHDGRQAKANVSGSKIRSLVDAIPNKIIPSKLKGHFRLYDADGSAEQVLTDIFNSTVSVKILFTEY